MISKYRYAEFSTYGIPRSLCCMVVTMRAALLALVAAVLLSGVTSCGFINHVQITRPTRVCVPAFQVGLFAAATSGAVLLQALPMPAQRSFTKTNAPTTQSSVAGPCPSLCRSHQVRLQAPALSPTAGLQQQAAFSSRVEADTVDDNSAWRRVQLEPV